MESLITKDGSLTLFNPLYSDYYHSKAGALAEARIKYLEPCRIAQLAANGQISLLDIGLGLGYNLGAAIDMAKSAGAKIDAVTLEMDATVLTFIKEMAPEIKSYGMIRGLADNPAYRDETVSIRLIVGNAVDTVKLIKESFDAVFHDPFAPTRNSELWTREFFTDVRKLMRPGAILATYSCARHVRDNLRAAGFLVRDGPVFGRRGPSTIAANPQ